MNGLAAGTDVSELTGCLLESIDLTQHQIQLRFDSHNGIRVSIEPEYSVTSPAGEPTRYDRPPAAAQVLADRLGVEVLETVVSAPGTLTFRLADGFVVDVYDSAEHHESYQIHLGERLIVA